MQWPDTEHIVDLPAVLRGGEAPDKQRPGNRPGGQRADRMHQIGTSADRHQPGQRAVVQEARVIAPHQQRSDGAADHRHQRVDRHQAADGRQGLGTHHVEAEPADDQDPRTQRQKRNVRRRERHQPALAVTTVAWPQQQHRRQRQPAAHGMHHDGAGEVMEARAKALLQPCLHPKVAVPDDALEERIDERHDQQGRAQLRGKARTLGDPAGNDRRDRRGEGQQKEELHQPVAVLGAQGRGRVQKVRPVRQPVADEKVGQGRHGEVAEDFRQRIDLILVAHRAHFEKGKTGVHGQHHDRPDKDEQGVGTLDQRVHCALQIFH